MAKGQYDKDNDVKYNPHGLYVKSFAEPISMKDAQPPVEFIIKGGFAFRVLIVPNSGEPPRLWVNGNEIVYGSGGGVGNLITIDFPRDATGAPRKDTIKVQRQGGGNDGQRVTVIYDKYVD